MALHPEFPKSPYAELLPEQRWFPAAEELRYVVKMATGAGKTKVVSLLMA